MRFRVRSPTGVATISLDLSATIDELRRSIASKIEFPTFELLAGYPPHPLNLDQYDKDLKVIDSGLKLEGEQLIARQINLATVLKRPVESTEPSSSAGNRLPPTHNLSEPPIRDISPPQDTSTSNPLRLSRKENNVSTDPPEVPVPSHNGILVLRVMPDDNSCMWRALGAAVLGSALDRVHELRALVAAQIQSQPEVYTKAVLEKSPDAYCTWIQRDDAWGGAIELGILAQQFDIEVCSVDVQSLRVDRFNEGRSTRCILVYSGIHYDVLALSPGTSMSDDFDVKVFSSADDVLISKAQELCEVLQKRHYFTDTAGFSIKCNQCSWTGRGEKNATVHAKQTGHMDFGEA